MTDDYDVAYSKIAEGIKDEIDRRAWGLVMKSIRPLESLTEKEFNNLKDLGMLWEIYPEAPEFWREVENSKETFKHISNCDTDYEGF